MLGGIVGVTRFVLSALLVPLAGCAAHKPATDLTYVDVRPDRISDQIFLADSIASAEGCEPPFADVREHRPVFSVDKPADECGGPARQAAGPQYVDAVDRITALHDSVVREWDVLLTLGPEAAEARAAVPVLLHCLDRRGFTQVGAGDPSLESYGLTSGKSADPARALAAQRCSDETGYGDRIASQRVRTLRSVLGKHEAEINEIAKLRPVLDRCARDRDRGGLRAHR
jgi:hypothetical protein